MTMASPPKRPKLSDSPSLPFHRSASPSKLPVRNESSALYRSPTRSSLAKRNPQHARRSPYAEPVKKRFISASQDETSRAGRLNFGSGSGGAGGMFGGRARSESVGAGIRRAGGSRLSSSPARRRSSFSNPLASSAPPSEDSPGKSDLGVLQEEGGVEDVSSPEPVFVMKKSKVRKGEPQARQQQQQQRSKRKRPETEIETKQRVEKERLERIMMARAQVLQAEIMELEEEVRIEKARVQRETQAAKDLDQDTDALVKRLLAVNDASQVVSIPEPVQRDEPVPSARPMEPDDPLPQLKAFTSITFTTHSSKIIPSTPVSQIITASGYASNRLLYFTVSLSVQSATVQEITYRISPWSVRELTPVLATAVEEGDIPTVFHAISTYTLIAKARASVFAKLSATFPHLLPTLAISKREKGKVSRREIIPYLGESLLRFHSCAKTGKTSRRSESGTGEGEVELILEWRIEFDVTGEPESVVSADVRLPSHLKKADELNSFSKLGGVFDSLVKEKGVYDAATCVVGLLFQ
ncbi:hypothetical protein B9Z19DRAFT_1111893 [Tuber borchii]|uniref:Uncharacterized protein n=1 Tax=Tuber borchii TaxID=42251 RepID=A0A2T7A9A7_TUBBO|nr:hypothetical protein B9Z19DRAFT_1111893 [Tuber borchii]